MKCVNVGKKNTSHEKALESGGKTLTECHCGSSLT